MKQRILVVDDEPAAVRSTDLKFGEPAGLTCCCHSVGARTLANMANLGKRPRTPPTVLKTVELTCGDVYPTSAHVPFAGLRVRRVPLSSAAVRGLGCLLGCHRAGAEQQIVSRRVWLPGRTNRTSTPVRLGHSMPKLRRVDLPTVPPTRTALSRNRSSFQGPSSGFRTRARTVSK